MKELQTREEIIAWITEQLEQMPLGLSPHGLQLTGAISQDAFQFHTDA